MTGGKKKKPDPSRRSFDPSRMRAAASLFDQPDQPPAGKTEPGAADRVTVSQLAAMIDSALKAHLPARVSVVGEVSGFKDRTHWYFSLKDAGAVVECVMFASAARRSSRPRDGEKVLARGRVEHYARQGRTQLYVDRIEPIGAGALEQQRLELCRQLKALGWFDPENKAPLPRFPRCVAVVTSKTSAAVHDVIDTFGKRAPFINLLIVDVRVQGDRAAPEIVRALERLGREHQRLGVDAIILTRGGGAIEDLWAFNERAIAQAIHDCPLPIVAAIGHETDTTIAELVADERAATPTQAAMRLSPDRDALHEQTEQLRARLRSCLHRVVAHEQQRLGAAARHPIISDPGALVRDRSARLESSRRALHAASRARLANLRVHLLNLTTTLARRRPAAVIALRKAIAGELDRRLRTATTALIARDRARLGELARTLDATGPMNVLRRGYSVTIGPDGRVIRSQTEARRGDLIETRLADGRFISTVGDHTSPAQPQDKTDRQRPSQPDLFNP